MFSQHTLHLVKYDTVILTSDCGVACFIAELFGHFDESHAVISLPLLLVEYIRLSFQKRAHGDSICRKRVFM